MTSELSYLRNYTITWGLLFQNRSRELFPTIEALMSKRIEICKSVNKIFWGEVFIVRNTVKN